jgi:hypothetical protein
VGPIVSRPDRRQIARRGYLAVSVRDRGPVPRGMKAAFNAASKKAWHDVGEYFHAHLREARFTEEHARAAGYARRKGELMPRGTKAFRRSYTGRKLQRFRHTRPLEFSGETRRAMRMATLAPTSKGVKVRYPGARAFNFRNPKSKVRMNEEFRRLTDAERQLLAELYDRRLDEYLKESAG